MMMNDGVKLFSLLLVLVSFFIIAGSANQSKREIERVEAQNAVSIDDDRE